MVRTRPSLAPPKGAKEFLEALEKTNVPQELMANADSIRKKVAPTTSRKKKKNKPTAPGGAGAPIPTSPDASPALTRQQQRKRRRKSAPQDAAREDQSSLAFSPEWRHLR